MQTGFDGGMSAIRKHRRLGKSILVRRRIKIDNLLLPLRSGFVSHLREKTGERVELLFRPLVSTLTHERQRHRGRNTMGTAILHGPVKVHLALTKVAAIRHQQCPGEMMERRIRPQVGVDPPVIGLRGIRPELDRKLRLHAQEIAPLHGPVLGELRTLQQDFNQLSAFA